MHPCLSQIKKKGRKRISKLLDFKKKRRFSFSFLVCLFFLSILKRKRLEANAVTSNHPPNPDPHWEREEAKWTGEKERKKQREMVDA